mmetsp:Transcript_110780/g.309593  ORF Transcript_110780/g.309593 Transcript_110780/m.309593 type:complete len:298 (+) Transcript_110780:341-1234(+)
MVSCTRASSPSRSEIFCSASVLACVQRRRLFRKDCTCRFKLAVDDACFCFLAFGSYFSEIASRLWIARSISMIICSCRRFSWSNRSSMRWISFFMAVASAWPMLGSSTCCISRSRSILRSQSMIWRSASTSSALSCPTDLRCRPMDLSSRRHLASMPLSFCWKPSSTSSVAPCTSAAFLSLLWNASLMRLTSRCKAFVSSSSSRISWRCPSSNALVRSFFCSSTIFLFLWSLKLACKRSNSEQMPKRSVCLTSHVLCICAQAAVSSRTSFCIWLSFASCGPAWCSSRSECSCRSLLP